MRKRAALGIATGLYGLLAAYAFGPLFGSGGTRFVDFRALYGEFALLGLSDTRLNTWILGWVQHSLLSNPWGLFDANVFYPALGTLAGSEHMIGVALPMLPLRIFTSDAVFIHQASLVVSALILAGTSAALVKWLTGSAWIAITAGAVAMFMPWRTTELMHLQLMSAHWIPLVWLLAFRILLGEARRRDPWLLGLVLSLQLLSSYYLAYQVTLSLAVVTLVAALQARASLRSVMRFAAAAAPAYALLGFASLPYLASRSLGVIPEIAPSPSEFPGALLTAMPKWTPPWNPLASGELAYSIPTLVALLALVTLLLPVPAGAAGEGLLRRTRIAVLSLWLCVLAAYCMLLGYEIVVAGVTLPLPGHFASRFVPGFSSLRAPQRWALLIGLAAPVLAGAGLRSLESRLPTQAGGGLLRPLGAGLVVVLLGLGLPIRRVPAADVWEHPERVAHAYAALRALPEGPVVEIPWRPKAFYLDPESRYMLASTLHWRPILNGFTAYRPRSYAFLQRIGHELPQPAAVERLRRLTDLRWVVVHKDSLADQTRRAWAEAVENGVLRRAWEDRHTLILEIPPHEDGGLWLEALREPSPRSTLRGLSRAPLDLPASAGRIEAATPAGRLRFWPMPGTLEIRVDNATEQAWPGFDADTEGLVQLRYVFAEPGGRVVKGGVVPLDRDVPAGASVAAAPLLAPPVRTGRYDLCLDLVQRIGPELRPLPVPPVEVAAEVVDPVGKGAEPPMQSPEDERRRATRSAFANAGRSPPHPETEVYRCR